MEWSRAFIVALKIAAIDAVFAIIILLLDYFVNILIAFFALIILVVVMIAVAVFFILKESEDMINNAIIASQMKKELEKEDIKSSNNAIDWIKSEIKDPKVHSMIDTLIDKNKKTGYLHPEILLESQIKEKITQGKTKEQAIEELYTKNNKKPRAKKELTSEQNNQNASEKNSDSNTQSLV